MRPNRIALKCHNPNCDRVFTKFYCDYVRADKHYCSNNCKFTDTQYGESVIDFVKNNPNMHITKMAKKLKLNESTLQKKISYWQRNGVELGRKVIKPRSSSQISATSFFSWETHGNNIITSF